MAVSQNLFLGRMRGKVGALVFSQNKGRNIVKAAPTIVANPRSGQQQANRSRFVALMALGRLLRPLLVTGFKEYAGSFSWLNKFMSTNSYSGLMVWNEATQIWEPEYSKLVISEGSLYQTPLFLNELDGADLVVDWAPGHSANQSATDTLHIIAFVGNQTDVSQGTVIRSAGTVTLSFTTAPVNGDIVTFVGYFQSSNGEIVSNSYAVQFVVGA